MISEERLKERLKERSDVYWHRKSDNSYYCIYACHCRFFEDEVEIIATNNAHWLCKYQDLITEEEYKWGCEFQNIKRTEYLNLPSWEEMSKYQYNEFKFVGKNGLEFTLVVLNGMNKYIVIRDNEHLDQRFYADGATKENYIKACEMAKRLFLGEEEK